jgi:hypothetical protein
MIKGLLFFPDVRSSFVDVAVIVIIIAVVVVVMEVTIF